METERERIWQNYTSFVGGKELLLQGIEFPSPHYTDLSAEADISDIQAPVVPSQVWRMTPTGPPETCFSGASFPSRVTFGLQSLWSSTCFHQWCIRSSHICKLFVRGHHAKLQTQWACFPVCFLQHSFSRNVFHHWIVSSWPSAVYFYSVIFSYGDKAKQPNSSWNHQTTFWKGRPIFVPTDKIGSKGMGLRRHRLSAQLCHLPAVCPWARLDFTSLAFFFSSVM